jgi:three-Cys-motif partner protein
MKPMNTIQQFGGDWTQQKLLRVKSYLSAYTTALKNTPFQFSYIDAFAGTGYREMKIEESQHLLFPDILGHDVEEFHDGSARIALDTIPLFHDYYFIESDRKKCKELEKLKAEYPDKIIHIINMEANEWIKEYWCVKAEKDPFLRAVMFLDPFGMSVSWETIKAIAKTKAVDMWYLFPLGVGVNRLLKKDGNVPDSWKRKLEDVFGNSDWEKIFYKKSETLNLFGETDLIIKKSGFKEISDYFIERLSEVFCDVSKTPYMLCNEKNNPLYMLCFACGNEKGCKVALNIANHILKM